LIYLITILHTAELKMGARASRLRNSQQVQDSSATNGISFPSDAGDEVVNNTSPNIKALKYEQNNNSNSNNNISNNNNDDDAEMVHDALVHQKALQAAEGGDTQQANGTPVPKGFSLQDRAANFAQRIRRSSSIKKLFPTFVAGRRKVSSDGRKVFCLSFVCLLALAQIVIKRSSWRYRSPQCLSRSPRAPAV
jgi:hypothetical protein